jgi:hypothetical protein
MQDLSVQSGEQSLAMSSNYLLQHGRGRAAAFSSHVVLMAHFRGSYYVVELLAHFRGSL